MALAGLMMVLGIVVIGVTLYGFSSVDSQFVFKSKEVITTEPAAAPTATPDTGTSGTTAQPTAGEKKTVETDFADTVVVFALTVGAALILAGGFYGRMRTLKLGALEIGTVGTEEEGKVADAAAAKVEEKVADPVKQEAAKVAAKEVARADLTMVAAAGVEPTDQVIELIAAQAAEKVASAVE